MTRAAAMALIALGAFLVLPQIVADLPEQRLVALGLILAVAGGTLLADHPRGHRG